MMTLMRKLTRLMGIPDLLNKVNIGPNRSIFTLLHVAYSAIHHCKKKHLSNRQSSCLGLH